MLTPIFKCVILFYNLKLKSFFLIFGGLCMNNRNYRSDVSPSNNFAVLSFFLAILALVFCFMPLISFILIIISVILGVSAYRDGNRGGAVAGLAISAVSLLIAIIVWSATGSIMCGVGGKTSVNEDYGFDEDYNYEESSYTDLSGTDLSLTDADLYIDAE